MIGHKGATQKFKPKHIKYYTTDTCPRCNSSNIHTTGQHSRTMVSIPVPQPHIVTKHISFKYECKCCNTNFQSEDNLPPRGSFDKSIIQEITSLFGSRMPLDVIGKFLKQRHGLLITNTTINSILYTATTLLQPFYEQIHHEINNSDVIGIDETTYRVAGKTAYVWVARSNNASFFALENSRGAKVVKKYWKSFDGILVSDGYKVYSNVFSDNIRQRCTAHLQREAKDVS